MDSCCVYGDFPISCALCIHMYIKYVWQCAFPCIRCSLWLWIWLSLSLALLDIENPKPKTEARLNFCVAFSHFAAVCSFFISFHLRSHSCLSFQHSAFGFHSMSFSIRSFSHSLPRAFELWISKCTDKNKKLLSG